MQTTTPEMNAALDRAMLDRLEALAQAEGIDVGEALSMVLHAGLEFAESHVVERRDRLDEITHELRDLRASLHVAGRAALGATLLLAHWASKSGSLRVSEDELLREIEGMGQAKWAEQLAQLGIVAPVE
jgi:hypothetical protein